MLKSKLGISYEQWTSNLRVRSGFPPFAKIEGDFTDFTVEDDEKCAMLSEWLYESMTERPNNAVTYHLEVKATTGRRDEPFKMSARQLAMVIQHVFQNVRPVADNPFYRLSNTTDTVPKCSLS